MEHLQPELREERECEMQHVIDVMVENGYPEACVERWKMNPPANSISRIKEEGKTSSCIPYMRGLSEQTIRILTKVDIRRVFKHMSWRGRIMNGVETKKKRGGKRVCSMK